MASSTDKLMQQGKLPPEGPVTVVILYAAHDEDADRAPVSSSCHSSLSCRIYATTARGQQQTNEQDGREKAENLHGLTSYSNLVQELHLASSVRSQGEVVVFKSRLNMSA